MSQTRIGFWPCFALGVTAVIFSATLFFIRDTPLPSTWDEALYVNLVQQDLQSYNEGGLHKLATSLRYNDTHRPPAYRILVLPYNLIFGVQTTALKAHALFFWCLTLWIMYLAGKSLAGSDAGAWAVMYLALAPIIAYGGKLFYTEYALYFSIAATLLTLLQIIKSDCLN